MHWHQGQCQSVSGWAEHALLPGLPGFILAAGAQVFLLFKMCPSSTRSLCSFPLFSAETAAEQFLFPFCLWQSPGALLAFPPIPPVLLSSSRPSLLPWCSLPLPAPIQHPFFPLLSLLQCPQPEDRLQTAISDTQCLSSNTS